MKTEKGKGSTRQVIPDEIQTLFGKPPLLYNESVELYATLLSKISLAIEPKDTIEWFWVKDVTDLLWEIQRLRRFKAMIINYGRKDALKQLFMIVIDDGQAEPGEAFRRAERLAHQAINGEPKVKSDLNAVLEKNGFDDEVIRARAFHRYIERIETADRMLAAAEIRRDRVLHEIEFRRETVGRRLREIAAAEGDKALRLPGPKGRNDNQVLDEPSSPTTAKGS
jgi:hypothetical protein